MPIFAKNGLKPMTRPNCILALLLMTSLLFLSCTSRQRVGIICGTSCEETDSLASLLDRLGFDCSRTSFADDLDSFDILWFHRPDSSSFSNEVTCAGSRVMDYLETGGKLILSMDAVRLLNDWGIEPQKVEVRYTDAVDYGFGRKVGFHGFRSHPVFDELFGGAYVWHGYQDNRNRVLGYFGDRKPMRPGSGVIGTLWEYIFYQPDDKIVWEEKVGKGSVVAVGAFLYYSRPNVNREILDRFTENLVNYMLGAESGSKAMYWDYDLATVSFDAAEASGAGNSAIRRVLKRQTCPSAWNVGEDPDALRFEAACEEITLPSRRTMLVALENGGIREIWTHPFMSLKNYMVSVCSGGKITPLDSPVDKVEFRYNSIIREYGFAGGSIKEILTVDPEKPVCVAHYEWSGPVDSLIVSFSSNMRYMWPYDEDALGTLHCGWSGNNNLYMVRDSEDEFVSIVGVDLESGLLEQSRKGNFIQADVTFSVHAGQSKVCNVIMAAGNQGRDKAIQDYSEALRRPEDVFIRSREHNLDYLSHTVSLETPDSVFNLGYRWANVSAGAFLAETPGIGTALMAGYSSSLRGWGGGHRVSGRPGYAWYFGRDSELSSLAFLASGDFAAVRSTLKLLADYQGVDGAIFHELTTSGSNHFDASDSTPLFVVLAAEYYRATSDLAFVKILMPNILKAMEFCMRTDRDGDHLIEIEHVGHGWLEGGDYFTGKTEFYLSAIWLRALRDAAYLANSTGLNDKAGRFLEESVLVEDALKGFWNEDKGYYNYGINYDGSYSEALLALASVPVWLGVTEEDKAYAQVCRYAGDDFSTDWGVRQTNDPRPEENVGAYDESNIWPLFTGSVSLAEYQTGRYNQGFDHLMSSLLCYRSATHGRVPEVIRGNAYRSGGITRHQCWSETAVTGPAITGMLGFRADAPQGRVTLFPRLPFDWRHFSARGLRCGGNVIGFDMEKSDSCVRLKLSSDSNVAVDFGFAFPPATDVMSVSLDSGKIEFMKDDLQEYTVVHCSFILDGKAELCIRMNEGISVLPSYREAVDGGPSAGIRIISQKAEDGNLVVNLQGKPGSEADLNLYVEGEKRTMTVKFDQGKDKTIVVEQ